MQPRVIKQLGKAQVQRGWQGVQPTQQQQLRQFFTKQAPVPLDPPAKLTAQKQKVEPQKPNTIGQVAKAQEAHIVPNNAVTRQHQLEQEHIQHAHNAQVTHHATQHRAAPVQSAQPHQTTVYHALAQEHAHAPQSPHPHSEHRPNDEQHHENSKDKKEKKNPHADQR
jgi:hypothetical protein